MWDVQNGSCPTTAVLRPLGETARMIHNNNSCSLLNTSLVLSALISVSPMEGLQTVGCAARQPGFKFHFLVCDLNEQRHHLRVSASPSVKRQNNGLYP